MCCKCLLDIVFQFINFRKTLFFILNVCLIVLKGSLALEWSDNDVVNWSSALAEEKFTPILVWWTPRLYPHFDRNVTKIRTKFGECVTTTSREPYEMGGMHSSPLIFLFYGTDLQMDSLPLPRLRHHHWALLHEESPMNNYALSHPHMIQLFNYTATFRRESHYPLTTLFLPDIGYLTQRQPVPLRTKNLLQQQQKLAPILYVQSHCDVASDRDGYVRELSKYVAVDSYGQCLHNRNLPQHLSNSEHFQNEEFLDFIANYKFHLAFENAICEDYITEKLFRALHVGSIPIYRGSPSVKRWVPTDPSLILVDDFLSPKELADFIISLDADDEQYEEYLKFKQPGEITNKFLISHMQERDWGVNDDQKIDFIQGFENFVCQKSLEMHDKNKEGNSLHRMSMIANARHMGCPPPQPSIGSLDNMLPKQKEDLMDWIDNYWYSGNLSDVLYKMIERNEADSSVIHHLVLKINDEL